MMMFVMMCCGFVVLSHGAHVSHDVCLFVVYFTIHV
jgi:hypothetical protein